MKNSESFQGTGLSQLPRPNLPRNPNVKVKRSLLSGCFGKNPGCTDGLTTGQAHSRMQIVLFSIRVHMTLSSPVNLQITGVVIGVAREDTEAAGILPGLE